MVERHWWIKPTSIVLGLFALVVATALVFGGVGDGKALSRSVDREAKSAFDGECAELADDWRCWTTDASGSGGGRYRVGYDGDCWRARFIGRDSSMPPELHGCVAVRDRNPIVGTFFDGWEGLTAL